MCVCSIGWLFFVVLGLFGFYIEILFCNGLFFDRSATCYFPVILVRFFLHCQLAQFSKVVSCWCIVAMRPDILFLMLPYSGLWASLSVEQETAVHFSSMQYVFVQELNKCCFSKLNRSKWLTFLKFLKLLWSYAVIVLSLSDLAVWWHFGNCNLFTCWARVQKSNTIHFSRRYRADHQQK